MVRQRSLFHQHSGRCRSGIGWPDLKFFERERKSLPVRDYRASAFIKGGKPFAGAVRKLIETPPWCAFTRLQASGKSRRAIFSLNRRNLEFGNLLFGMSGQFDDGPVHDVGEFALIHVAAPEHPNDVRSLVKTHSADLKTNPA